MASQAKTKLALVVSEFNKEISDQMLQGATEDAEKLGAQITYVCRVPGAFDMPLVIRALLEKKDVDAVATLGAIVKGETLHDEIIARELVQRISMLSLEHSKPVTLGVSGPGMSWDQGVARASEYAQRAVRAAIKMCRRYQRLIGTNPTNYPCMIE